MHSDLPRQRQTSRQQHRGPVETVKARNIFADNMGIGGPVMRKFFRVIGKTDGGQVIGQSVEPDIDDLLLIARYRHSPLRHTWAHETRDGKIPQSLANQDPAPRLADWRVQ